MQVSKMMRVDWAGEFGREGWLCCCPGEKDKDRVCSPSLNGPLCLICKFEINLNIKLPEQQRVAAVYKIQLSAKSPRKDI